MNKKKQVRLKRLKKLARLKLLKKLVRLKRVKKLFRLKMESKLVRLGLMKKMMKRQPKLTNLLNLNLLSKYSYNKLWLAICNQM